MARKLETTRIRNGYNILEGGIFRYFWAPQFDNKKAEFWIFAAYFVKLRLLDDARMMYLSGAQIIIREKNCGVGIFRQ